ncbi:hypothetical protein DEV91_10945 [Phyllobacterium brassicacearum]|nr:hypothetical protein DEV91_10945 [Phyllobacterium brassicacearum]
MRAGTRKYNAISALLPGAAVGIIHQTSDRQRHRRHQYGKRGSKDPYCQLSIVRPDLGGVRGRQSGAGFCLIGKQHGHNESQKKCKVAHRIHLYEIGH